MNILGFLQRFGRVLQLLIAMLLVTAPLLRSGQPNLLNVALIAQAGDAISDSLALIFAIGVASSQSKDSAGAATLVGAVSYFVLTRAMVTINPEINMGVLTDIIAGLVGGAAYNRRFDIKLPDFLSFFGGKRFVSITTGFFCLVLAVILGYVWLLVQHVIHADGRWIVSAGALGSGIFSFINRLLIPTGLHQVLSTVTRFQIDEFTNATGAIFHDDINHFYAGDGIAGVFMSGFFPIMMFGLPGAALAIYSATLKECHPVAGDMLLPVAVITFLIGVTEPLEFLFMFLTPLLYLLHVLLANISLFTATLLGIHAGLSFSIGVIDYTLMYNLPATNQNVWMLLMVGVIFFAICFVVFSLVIRMFNLKMPGREDKGDEIATGEINSNTGEGLTQLATDYIVAVGGTDNLRTTDICITRLRPIVADSARVNDTMRKRLGTSGVAKLNKQAIWVIADMKVKSVGDAMKKVVARGPVAAMSAEATPATATSVAEPQAIPNVVPTTGLVLPITGGVVALDRVPDEVFASKMMSDGMVMKPTDKIVVSLAAGTTVKISNANHVSCLETEKDTEIVIHMGIDIVALEGKGFKCLVEEGAQASAGWPILEIDLDYLNASARSMISPVVCSNIGDFSDLIIEAQGHIMVG